MKHPDCLQTRLRPRLVKTVWFFELLADALTNPCYHALSVGKITLPSTILKFWDLGGQRGIRSIWHRYYDDCHAVVYVIDAQDRERLSEGWEVFGTFHLWLNLVFNTKCARTKLLLCARNPDSVLTSPEILGVPLLLLANKQDSPDSLSVEEIRNDYEDWYRHKLDSTRRTFGAENETEHRRERIASLDVMGISALEG